MAPPIALTTLPAKLGCRSPKKLTARPSARRYHQHPHRRRAWRPARASPGCRPRRAPGNSGRRARHGPGPRAPSTVLGCVPAATRIVRAGRTISSPGLCSGSGRCPPTSCERCRVSRSAAAWPKRSTSTALGVRPFGEADALLHRLRHLLVVEGVARRVDQAAAIGDRDAAPAVEQRCQMRGARPSRAAASRSARIARAWAMNSSATSRSAAFQPRAPPPRRARPPASRSATGTSRPAPGNRRATRSRCRSRSARRRSPPPAAAPSDWRCCPSLAAPVSCKRHQKIRRLAHPGRETVLHRDHRRPAGAGAQRDMVEAQRKGAVDRRSCRQSARRHTSRIGCGARAAGARS